MSEVQVTNNTELNRWEARLDGQLAGFAEYHLRGTSVVFTHTEVDPAFEGQGIGSAIIRTSLTDIREDGGLDVIPVCPFYKGWIEKHPDFADLVHHGGSTA